MKRRLAFLVMVIGVATAGTILWRSGTCCAVQGAAIMRIFTNADINPEIFIDVRTDEEWNTGHINGALHFDLARMQQGQLPDLPKNASVALYCRTGIRAGQALRILEENGFMNARDAGGFAALQGRGIKTCTGIPPTCD